MNLLQEYQLRFQIESNRHPVVLEAAQDPALSSANLFADALRKFRICWAAECAKSHDCFSPFSLYILQHRIIPEVKRKAFELLKADEPVERYVSVCLLREFPGLEGAPHPHAPEVIRKLEAMLEDEDEECVYRMGIAAVGWQRHPAGVDVLLEYREDEDKRVRYIVADNLLGVYPEKEPMPCRIANALLDFATDSFSEIRWSVFHDIAEYPTYFHSHNSEFLAAAIQATNDPAANVAQEAERAVNALLTMKA